MTKTKAVKIKEMYKEKYRKGVLADKDAVLTDLKRSSSIELLEAGKMSDGSEFITVKIFVK